MSQVNHHKLPDLIKYNLPMSVYDTLPPAVRKALQDAPYNFSLSPEGVDLAGRDGGAVVDEIQRIAKITMRKAALADYGPEHPQAK